MSLNEWMNLGLVYESVILLNIEDESCTHDFVKCNRYASLEFGSDGIRLFYKDAFMSG